MMNPKMKRNLSLVIFIASSYHLVKQQTNQNASNTLIYSSIFFAIFYAVLRTTRFLHPTKGVLSNSIDMEWTSRVVGTFHAILLVLGSLQCFYENAYYLNLEDNRGYGPTSITSTTVERDASAVFFSSLFCGYLHYDMCYLLWTMEDNCDPSSMVHHFLYILITHYNLSGSYFVRPFAWLSFGELSTPFLHGRWFYAVQGKKDDVWYTRLSILFAMSFLFTRVLCFTLGLIDLWCAMDIWMAQPVGAYFVVLGIHLGYALNLFWATKVVGALTKAMSKNKKN